MADQIMTADKQRLEKRIGRVSPPEMLGTLMCSVFAIGPFTIGHTATGLVVA